MPILQMTEAGLFCPAGDFFIDPWRPVPRAIITHGHSDHARPGSERYLCHTASGPILRQRLGPAIHVDTLAYGEGLQLGPARVSLHPAGHVLGSAQVRVEVAGEVCVVSGDYKLAEDPTCTPFEPVRCHTFITESTFGLPVYQWPRAAEVQAEINRWWAANQQEGRTSILFAYSLGKAQRLLAGLNPEQGPIAVHASIAQLLPAYAEAGVKLPDVLPLADGANQKLKGRGLVLAPAGVADARVLRPLAPTATATASGWMRVRGRRRWQNVERGFVLSDHADWPGLLATIAATGASSIGVTHGAVGPMVRYLREERGLDAWPLRTEFGGEE